MHESKITSINDRAHTQNITSIDAKRPHPRANDEIYIFTLNAC
jgi:hypothetical protein